MVLICPACWTRFTLEMLLNNTTVACRVKISQSEALKLLSGSVCEQELKCLHKATCQGPVYLCGRMIHGVHCTRLCLTHPYSYVIPTVGNLTEDKVPYVSISHTANPVTVLKFWNCSFHEFCFIFIYKTNLMHELQTHLKVQSFTAPTCFATFLPSSGSSYTKFKTCCYITDYIHNTY
jgi:hypothetical protein